MKRLFISDLHLDESRPDITRAFLEFMDRQASRAEELYILGDFFESWIGDDDSSGLIEQVRAALKSCSEAGTQVFFMPGNRDFLLGETFCQSCGISLLDDPSTIEIGGQAALLMHGDSLCIDDSEYMQFRQLARSPAWQQDVLSKPLEERRALAQQLRMASQEANSNKAEDIMDVNPDEVQRVMSGAGVRLLIHGHTHRPARHPLPSGEGSAERLVLGDWEHQAIYLSEDRGQLSLQSWAIS